MPNYGYPVHTLTYKCCSCDHEYTKLGRDEPLPPNVEDAQCCTDHKALLIKNEPIAEPSWKQVVEVYGQKD